MTDDLNSEPAAEDLPAHENWVARNSKTISTLATVAIPIVLAIVGTIANININNQNNDRQYVQLSYDILSKNEPSETEQDRCDAEAVRVLAAGESVANIGQLRERFDDDVIQDLPTVALRNYGLDLLVATTPVQLSVEQYVSLLCGKVNFPVSVPDSEAGQAAVPAPDSGGDEVDDAGRFAEIIQARRSAFDALEAPEAALPEGCRVTALAEAPTLDGTVVIGELTALATREGDLTFVKVTTPAGDAEWMEVNEKVVLAQEGCEPE